ncbi:roadblock/LC7 domain-containing protein [Streptomyces millisiae]|uniref:Roadblock/LC7 domain-containing protein n=1 Tax=Streptomyces millisiae TaxID=3075542 RepID=A0ABU2LWC0_9ACTN|nr:roadblock/LC7 domain-containing protein [Streptomyces sp. DSM 44918]MDT0321891.1 roadblock/LC7 domain-containing protein [Streptomyces sp. DSM 44918]
MIHNPEVQRILSERINNIAGVRAAVVLADDGLPRYWSGLEKDDAERRAALSSSLGTIAARIAADEEAGVVKRTLIEMEKGFFVVARCGERSYLAVSARPDANLSVVGYELTLLTKQLATVLDTDPRQGDQGGPRT